MTIPRIILPLALVFAVFPGAQLSPAQSTNGTPTAPTPIAASAPTAVPALVPFTGSALSAEGKPLRSGTGITFMIFKDEQGGDELWAETQSVDVDAAGHYKVQLGAGSPNGLPAELFTTGEARWLEIQIAGEKTQPRVLLASVPYALKAADAESLAGHAVSDFVTQKQLAQLAQPPVQTLAQSGQGAPDTAVTELAPGSLTGSGTSGTVPLWTGALTQGNSEITQTGADIGINEATPGATLDVGGTATFRGTTTLPAEATATTSAGYRSQLLDFTDSAWSTTTKAPVAQSWRIYATDSGNNTANPISTLNFQFQNGAGAATPIVLSIAQTGVINFAPNQTFPGTIKSLAATSPVTATTTSGVVSLGLNTAALESTLNSTYAQLGTANTFSKPITFAAGQTFPGTGTLKGVSASSPLTAETLLGNANLSLNTTALETTLNSVYPRLAAANTFTAHITFAAGQMFPGTLTNVTVASPLTASTSGGVSSLGLDIYSLEATLDGLYPSFGGNNEFKGYTTFDQGIVSSSNSLFFPGVAGWGTSGATGLSGTTDTGQGVYGRASGDGNGGYFTNVSQGWSTLYAINTASAGAGGYPNAITGATTGNGTIAITGSTAGTDSTSVYGYATGTGSVGVSGFSGAQTSAGAGIKGTGVSGSAAQGIGVLGTMGTTSSVYNKNYTNGQLVGVWGDSVGPASVGVFGTSDSGFGGGFSSDSENAAVYGTNGGTGAGGEFVNDSATVATLLVYNGSVGGTGAAAPAMMVGGKSGTCGIGAGGDLSCTGQLKSVNVAGGARKVETYAMQSPENWMEDFGSGELQRGAAVVHIDPTFAETVTAEASYHVFITPNGDSKGLYVIRKTATTFEVRESGGGVSSLTFDYRIVAKRRGYEAQRLTDVTERFKSASKAIVELPVLSTDPVRDFAKRPVVIPSIPPTPRVPMPVIDGQKSAAN